MSTTTNREQALTYSWIGMGRNRCTVLLEIHVGYFDPLADISFLSQYPDESEFLYPPLSCLEVNIPFLLNKGRLKISALF